MSFEKLIRDKFVILFLICENLKDDPIEIRANGTAMPARISNILLIASGIPILKYEIIRPRTTATITGSDIISKITLHRFILRVFCCSLESMNLNIKSVEMILKGYRKAITTLALAAAREPYA
jgi:hypothetical protein